MTTWNQSDSGGGTLSNGNLTITFGASRTAIRSTTSKTTGKYHIEFTITAADSSSDMWIGVGNSSATLSGFVGSDANGEGTQINAAGAALNTYTGGNLLFAYSDSPPFVNHVFGLEVDIGNHLAWWEDITAATGWTNGANAFGGNPGAGTGGTSFSAITGAIFIMASGANFGTTAPAITLNPGSTFTGIVSSGFSAWDPAAATTSVCGSLTLLGVGCAIGAEKLSENPIVSRRSLIIPRGGKMR